MRVSWGAAGLEICAADRGAAGVRLPRRNDDAASRLTALEEYERGEAENPDAAGPR